MSNTYYVYNYIQKVNSPLEYRMRFEIIKKKKCQSQFLSSIIFQSTVEKISTKQSRFNHVSLM